MKHHVRDSLKETEMIKAKPGNSIRFKFIFVIAAIQLAGALLISLVVSTREARVLRESFASTGRSLASYMAVISKDPVINKDGIQLDSIVMAAVNGPNIVYAVVCDANGVPITSEYSGINYKLPYVGSLLATLPKEMDLRDIIKTIRNKTAIIEVSTPIVFGPSMTGSDRIGAINIGLSGKVIVDHIRKTMLYIVAFGFVLATVLIFVLYFVSHTIIFSPLGELADASSRIAAGDLSVDVRVDTSGEIKTLVDSFNRMVRNLEKVTVSKDYVDGILKNIMNCLIVTSPDGVISTVNTAACKLLGYKEEELAGRPVGTVFCGSTSDEDSWMKTMMTDGLIGTIEECCVTKEGDRVPVLLSGSVMRAEDDSIKGMVYAAQDISERKCAEEALLRAKNEWEQTFDAVPDLMAIVGTDYRILRVNRAMAARLGKAPGECIGMKCFEAIHGDCQPPPSCPHMQLIQDGLYHVTELFEGCLGGEFVVSLSPLFGPTGELIGSVHVARDITERRQAEEERKRLEEQLQRAEKMQALGTLAGGVAHDLNNVLGVVVGYSELLLRSQAVADTIKSRVKAIFKAGEKAAAIIQDLLTLARRGIQDRKVLHLNDLLREALNSPQFAAVMSYHPEVELKTDLEAGLLNTSGSPVHLEKSFINLVSNAAEAMPAGGLLTIGTFNQYLDKPVSGYDTVEEGDYVVLSVSDTGDGISAPDMKRIFEPFYTKKILGRSGTGLGLAVVWGTVKDHDGYIDVKSEQGKGTVFTLYFPVTREEMTPEKAAVSVSEYMGRGETILVVDDVEEQRSLATEMLEKLNYSVASVSSGEEAVERLRGRTADLIILDMIMDPGMDGLETYSRVLGIHPNQKAIIVSGFSETERVSRALTLGAGACVKKPYTLEKLGLTVRQELDRRR